jgi:hypothetical protein
MPCAAFANRSNIERAASFRMLAASLGNDVRFDMCCSPAASSRFYPPRPALPV